MKKLLILVLLLGLCVKSPAMSPHFAGGGVTPAGGGECGSYTIKSDWGANSTTNSLGDVESDSAWASTIPSAGETYTIDRVAVYLLRPSGSATGTVYAYIYDPDNGGSEAAPDDLLATSETELDISTISSGDWYNFDFATPATHTNGTALSVVLFFDCTSCDASNDARWSGDSFISASYGAYDRTGTPPATPNDSSNWGENDANGGHAFSTYACDD